MVKTITLQTDISPHRVLQISLPKDIPTGPAEVVVVIATRQPVQADQGGTAADMAASPLFGLWSERTDLGDSQSYARKLRAQAERRDSEPNHGGTS